MCIRDSMNIEDKHRRLNVVGAAVGNVVSSVSGPNTVPVSSTSRRSQPFRNGEEIIVSILVSSSDKSARYAQDGEFDIALDPQGPAKGAHLKDCLVECRNAVE